MMLTAYWLAPNDWLLVNPAADTDRIKVALRDASGSATAVVTDMTDAWSIIDISGEDAPARLAQGCSVDLHDSAFPRPLCIDTVATPVRHYPSTG